MDVARTALEGLCRAGKTRGITELRIGAKCSPSGDRHTESVHAAGEPASATYLPACSFIYAAMCRSISSGGTSHVC